MSVRRLDPVQPEAFAFSDANRAWAGREIGKYPDGQQAGAVIALLWRAQEQAGDWLPEPAIRHVGELLEMPYIRVLEVATFYTMFNLSPVGRTFVQLCGTTPCWLRGADGLKQVCRELIGEPGEVTADGALSWAEVECLGACVNAPMVQIGSDYYEDLTPDRFRAMLVAMRSGIVVAPGPQNGRQHSAPLGGPTSLTDASIYARPADPYDGHASGALTDDDAKRPGDSANDRAEPGEHGVTGDATGKSQG